MLPFVDNTNQHCGFQSSDKENRYVNDCGCQTVNITYEEKTIQSFKRKTAECQTETASHISVTKAKDSSQKLLSFLLKNIPVMIEALEHNVKSHAFSNYKVVWDDDSSISCLFKLRHEELKDKLPVTTLSWNASSSVVAASFGRLDHEDCCMHISHLCTWNIDRNRLDPSRADKMIEVDSCLMVVSWHPSHPSIIAGGTFNGEVKVWDLNNEDSLLQSSTERGGDSHDDAVSGLRWIIGEKMNQLFSIGGDGRMFLWEFNQFKRSLVAMCRFCLLSESFPRHIRAKVGSQQLLALTSVDFNHFDESSFVVGSDGGFLFRCSLLMGCGASYVDNNARPLNQARSPVISSSSVHNGPVHSIQFSPHHADIFMSASYDGTFVIHSLQQMKPLKRVHAASSSIYHAQWSPWRPVCVALATFEGSMKFFDLSLDSILPVQEIQASRQAPLTFVMFNSKRPGLLSAGDADGNLTIWNLNSQFYEEKKNDLEILENLLLTY